MGQFADSSHTWSKLTCINNLLKQEWSFPFYQPKTTCVGTDETTSVSNLGLWTSSFTLLSLYHIACLLTNFSENLMWVYASKSAWWPYQWDTGEAGLAFSEFPDVTFKSTLYYRLKAQAFHSSYSSLNLLRYLAGLCQVVYSIWYVLINMENTKL